MHQLLKRPGDRTRLTVEAKEVKVEYFLEVRFLVFVLHGSILLRVCKQKRGFCAFLRQAHPFANKPSSCAKRFMNTFLHVGNQVVLRILSQEDHNANPSYKQPHMSMHGVFGKTFWADAYACPQSIG